ncbi:uncharacterized protein LOC105392946 [Plutella xylostella]|uniref:uncharacterized protein LOC105392946 n=1 Tax=Plutella xylostella TaxID=51655 RepID=UPI00203315A4|nr:uncharacterized protein LOC105392946 [Plutella xylostella]
MPSTQDYTNILEEPLFGKTKMCCSKIGISLSKGKYESLDITSYGDPNDYIFLVAFYFLFILFAGPNFMKNRPALKLRTFHFFFSIMLGFNSAFLSAMFLFYITQVGLFPEVCFEVAKNDPSNNSFAKDVSRFKYNLLSILYYKFLVSKAMDLLHSFILILRKKGSLITFTHVYHSMLMLWASWAVVKYDRGNHWTALGCVNSAVQALVHVENAIKALGRRFVKCHRGRDCVRVVQMMQFVFLYLYMIVQIRTSQCPVHPYIYWTSTANVVVFTLLFIHFKFTKYSAYRSKVSSID